MAYTAVTVPQGTFEFYDCPNCGVWFAAPKRLVDSRRADKGNLFCPNGHSMSWRESEADRLRRERDNLKQQMARVEQEGREAAAARVAAEEAKKKAERETARLRKRVSAGVCPDCNRTFANLARHMSCKHGEAPKPKLVAERVR